MWVKICGITTMKAGVAAYEAGADAVGFVFAPSRRQVDPDRAQALIMGLPADIAKVGVFVNEEPGAINAIARYAGLTHVQLHGDEPPEMLGEIELPVLKAFRLRSVGDLAKLPAYRKAAGLLLEPYVDGQAGGTGQRLDLSLFKAAAGLHPMLILAGGLDPGNVLGAIREARPHGVDVSSGVETDGQKDLNKIYDFTDLAKEALDA
ncbi:MAG TPA: phosphoribosylanthranilate isomerase [Symbiobacteriaceae bacterium]|nr:phosphoribosylanthranilate isomerase [Symbiobacteriaceae bacterium]